ncbi:26S proteasome non-ATPase regulatory subunit 12 [Toxocara canis]|uniref:26S proteasome non-ATPase regulatory subunit 12 n=1 Tax=Toxocara canis TaxID=6265 RepID=A0A0B2VBV3_TOXCA|nr:26S proteasome non-ATPase regulatory subunit 12 [Toxocara canis]
MPKSHGHPKRSSGRKSSTSATEDVVHFATQEGDGRLFKMDVDYTPQVDEALPKADAIAKAGNVELALESLWSLEKQSRLGADMKSNTRIVRHMVKLCFDASAWALLSNTVSTLSKKRSIIKVAIAKMIGDCCEMVDKMPNEDLKWKLVETLREVTAGKIYVEVERARLTSLLAKKLESAGRVEEATTILLELQVETYGSMDMKEKVEFLLEQMRLCVLRKDFIRESILAKKISVRFFEDQSEAVQQLKLKYCDLMIKLCLSDNAYLDVCRYYRQVYDTPCIQSDDTKTTQALKCMILYVLLSPHSSEQSDLLHHINEMRQLEAVPEYKLLLELFINQEIIFWKDNIVAEFESLLRIGTRSNPATGVFGVTKSGNKRWTDFQSRVAEHGHYPISQRLRTVDTRVTTEAHRMVIFSQCKRDYILDMERDKRKADCGLGMWNG